MLQRTGGVIRPDHVNTYMLEFRGGKFSQGQDRRHNESRAVTEAEKDMVRMKNVRDYFQDYFNTMKKHFKLPQKFVDLAMDKVEQYI